MLFGHMIDVVGHVTLSENLYKEAKSFCCLHLIASIETLHIFFTMMQKYEPDYDKWEAHFKAMADGNYKNVRSRVVKVKSPTQKGSGVRLVSAAQEIVNRAKARKEKALNNKKTIARRHTRRIPKRVPKKVKGVTKASKKRRRP